MVSGLFGVCLKVVYLELLNTLEKMQTWSLKDPLVKIKNHQKSRTRLRALEMVSRLF